MKEITRMPGVVPWGILHSVNRGKTLIGHQIGAKDLSLVKMGNGGHDVDHRLMLCGVLFAAIRIEVSRSQ